MHCQLLQQAYLSIEKREMLMPKTLVPKHIAIPKPVGDRAIGPRPMVPTADFIGRGLAATQFSPGAPMSILVNHGGPSSVRWR